ncbi:hypothetical protein ACNAWD_15975 [Rhodococcus erythropolis]|uniref:Uncharacterized protein n=2 Tax=Rhodococcus erythropolis TaxID=1833 RepID=A0A0C3A7J8_RHOER|nr:MULTISPECIES: hypothetical protein [Rhodococcus]KAB2586235.1 hypothetical protein BS297_06340 [Rhodococcus erythropolis]KIM16114.1 hypothetical protein QV65_17035 [Rhodococcus erythropolis]MBT1258686.1 hypothetical protein [Rhodococcus erythropolis]MCW2301578.1 MFS family permease [Rhodococcus erythropolis]MCZ4566214.1 hypothetical protein [Rhodococcus erythropolis]
MWKQALGFALFGATVAIVTAALTQGSSQASATITLFSGGTTISGFAGESQWAWPIEAAVIGAVLGALTGLVLHLAGVRISGGQDNRMLRTVVAGLVGVTLGLTPLLVLISMAFTRSVDIGWSPLLVYAVSGFLAYGLAVAAVFGVLRAAGDRLTTRTAQAVAAMLPVGALAATTVGVGTAWRLGFSTAAPTWIAVVLLVVLVLAMTFVAARAWALRIQPRDLPEVA